MLPFIKKYHVIVFLITLMFVSNIPAQENQSGRIPNYPIPYTFPSINNIKETLNRIKSYYESTSSLTIVDTQTGNEITNFAKFNPNAEPSHGFSSEYSYTNGVVLSAFIYIYQITGDTTYLNDNIKFFDFVTNNLPYFQKNSEKINKEKIGGWGRILKFHALDDCGSIGAALIKTYSEHENKKYLELINRTADFISNTQFRLEDGTLARNRPQYESVWADDLYMSVPFLVNMGKLTGNNAYYDDAVKQVLQIANRLFIPNQQLFDHGWNKTSSNYDPHFYWGRANGWALMTMAELLSVLPENYKGREQILHLYRSQIQSLANLQDGSGFWHNLLDKPDSYQETSCTAMITFAIAKGINEGWISHIYGPMALTGWNAISTQVLKDGSVDGTCEGTTFAHDNVYYYNRGKSIHATHGYGPVLYAGAEMIRLLQNDKIEIQKAKDNAINSTYHFILKSEWPTNK